MRTLLLAAALVAATTAEATTAPTDAPADRPAALRDVGFDQRLGETVPLDVVLRDETGAAVRLGAYFGEKPVLLVPAYATCPMLCPLVLSGVVSALRALPFDVGREFTVVIFSFDPRETPAEVAAKRERLLQDYRRPNAAAGWHFLTGDEPSVRRLAAAVGFRYAFDERQQQYAHASGIVVLTPEGRIARYFFGVEFPPRDLRLALVEASAGRIGSPVDQLLLFCFHWDPATGRYSRLALDAVRVAGFGTVVALATFVGAMLRRERRRRAAGAS
jgi:protein SCO1/2